MKRAGGDLRFVAQGFDIARITRKRAAGANPQPLDLLPDAWLRSLAYAESQVARSCAEPATRPSAPHLLRSEPEAGVPRDRHSLLVGVATHQHGGRLWRHVAPCGRLQSGRGLQCPITRGSRPGDGDARRYFRKANYAGLKGSGCEGNHETKPGKHAATVSGKYVQG